jgi:hypothetical protein
MQRHHVDFRTTTPYIRATRFPNHRKVLSLNKLPPHVLRTKSLSYPLPPLPSNTLPYSTISISIYNLYCSTHADSKHSVSEWDVDIYLHALCVGTNTSAYTYNGTNISAFNTTQYAPLPHSEHTTTFSYSVYTGSSIN